MQEDQENELGIYDLNATDDELLQLIKRPLTKSDNHWTKELGQVWKDNFNLWLPNHYKDKEIYDFQEEYLYQDPRIFVSVETILSIVNGRIPIVDVMPAQDTVVSRQMAKDLSKTLKAYSAKHRVLDYFKIQARNLLIKRIGWIKLYYDKQTDDIITDTVSPEDIVVEYTTRYGDVPKMIAHKIKDKSFEDMLVMYPEAEQKIYELAGATRRNKSGDLVAYKTQLSKSKNLWEVWFTYLEDGKYKSGVAVIDEDFQHVLLKMKNPNWNYRTKKGFTSNFLDAPVPPFIPINVLNDGSSYIDQTSMVEQAAPLQRILNRRGLQIMENAEQGGSGLVFNTSMIKIDDIALLTGSPDERIGVNGDVRSAVTRVSPPPLPSYVIEDKMDARHEIDTVFATYDVTRGEATGNKTLGQDQLQREQNYTRMDDITRAMERTVDMYYRYLIQMMKVYYTEEHYFRAVGEDGRFDYVVMKDDMIEDGIDIQIQPGSMLPINKDRQLSIVKDLSSIGVIDPMSVYEVLTGGDLPSPQKMLERYLLIQQDPMAYMSKVQEDEFNREAYIDIQQLIRGKMPKVRNEVKPEYLKFINNYMLSGDFNGQPETVQQMFVEFLRLSQEVAQRQLEALRTQAPTQEDMNQVNQQALEQAQIEQGIAGAQPQQQQKQAGSLDQKANALAQKASNTYPATPAPSPTVG